MLAHEGTPDLVTQNPLESQSSWPTIVQLQTSSKVAIDLYNFKISYSSSIHIRKPTANRSHNIPHQAALNNTRSTPNL